MIQLFTSKMTQFIDTPQVLFDSRICTRTPISFAFIRYRINSVLQTNKHNAIIVPSNVTAFTVLTYHIHNFSRFNRCDGHRVPHTFSNSHSKSIARVCAKYCDIEQLCSVVLWVGSSINAITAFNCISNKCALYVRNHSKSTQLSGHHRQLEAYEKQRTIRNCRT